MRVGTSIRGTGGAAMRSYTHLRGSSAAALIVALALLGAAAPLTKVWAQSAEARLETVERENAILRQEVAALRDRLRAEKARIVRRVASQAAPIYASVGAGPVYKAPPAAPIVYGWTGFYAGVNVGLSVGRNSSTRTETFVNANPAFNEAVADTFKLAPFGVIGGGQVGYNWQVSPSVVLGIEADFQGSGQRDTACVFQCTIPAATGFDRHETIAQQLDWFGTVRGRVGWTNGPVLFYGTGGLAYGQARLDQTWAEFNFGTAASAAASTTLTKAGWTAGAGIEAQLWGNWTGKIEYLYLDLGGMSGATFVFPRTGNVLIGEVHDFTTAFRDHIVRVGVNYKFGDPVYVASAPASGMIYKAPPAAILAYDWTGAYVGGNLGLSVGRNPTSTPFNTINNTTGVVGPVTFAESVTLSPFGVIGGGQVGYNRQVAPSWVLGVEADFQGSGQKDSACLFCRTPQFAATLGGLGTSYDQHLDWFGTVRGRAGWTNGWALLYATAGLAYGHVKTDEAVTTVPFLTSVTTTGSFAQTKVGWTAGAGIEAHLVGRWTGKLEYLYMDLGDVGGSVVAPELVIPLNVNPGNVNLSENRGFNSSVRDHIVRLGVNYKFDDGPVAAKY